MKLLLTSGGITTATIQSALVELLGRPIEECSALCIPTALWGHPWCGPQSVREFVAGEAATGSMTALPWRSLGVLELTALSSLDAARWTPWVREADALLVDGGDATYLAHHLRLSGLADLLPELETTVWVGVSAGSMVLTPRIGAQFVEWPGAADDRGLGLVDFSIFPHLDVFASNTLHHARAWAEQIGGPAYALDDRSALMVDADGHRVVSDGEWVRLR